MGFCPEDAGAAETLELLERKTGRGRRPLLSPFPASRLPPLHPLHLLGPAPLELQNPALLSTGERRETPGTGSVAVGPSGTNILYFQLYTDLISPDVEKFESIVSYKQCYKTLL